MNSIIRYIVNGKGYGFKFLTLFSVLLALVMGGVTYYRIKEYSYSASVQSFIANIPILEIKNEKLIAPYDTHVVLEYPALENTFFVINTQSDDFDLMRFETVFYLTPDRAYLKTGPNIQTIPYEQDMIITPDLIQKTVQMTAVLMPIFFGIFLFFCVWIGFAFLYFVSKLFLWLIKKTISPAMRSRIVLLSWISILLIDLIFSFFGLGFSLSMAFVWTLIVIALILLKISEIETM